MCYDVIAIFSGSDRIENQDIGARAAAFTYLLSPILPSQTDAVTCYRREEERTFYIVQ
jgi:hypothetical protein